MGMLFQVTLQAADVGEWEPKQERKNMGDTGSATTISPPLECMLYDCKDFYVSFTEVSYVFVIVPGT